MALLIGFCFFGVNLDQDGIQNIQGAIFIFITENTFPSMYGVLHVFPHEVSCSTYIKIETNLNKTYHYSSCLYFYEKTRMEFTE